MSYTLQIQYKLQTVMNFLAEYIHGTVNCVNIEFTTDVTAICYKPVHNIHITLLQDVPRKTDRN